MPRPPPVRDARDTPRALPAAGPDALPAAMAAAAAAASTTATPRAPPPPYDATMHDRLAAWLRDHDARLRAQVDRLNDDDDDDDEDIHDALNHYDGLGDAHDDDDLSDSSSASGSDLTLAMMRSAQPYTSSGMTRDVLMHEDEDGLEAVVLHQQHPALAYSSDEEGGESDIEVPVAGPRNAVPGNVYRGASTSAAAAAARAVSPALSSDDEADGEVHRRHHHRHHHHHHEQAPASATATTAAAVAAQPTDARARDVVDMMRQLRRELDYVSSVMADHLPAPGGNATGRASPGQLPAAAPVPDLLTPSTDTLPEYEPLADTATQQRPAVRLRSTLATAIAGNSATRTVVDPVRTHATGSSSASASGVRASPTARHSWAAPAATAAGLVGPRVRSAVSHAPRPKSMSVVPDPRTTPSSSSSSGGNGVSTLGFRAADDPMPMVAAARARAQSTSALDAPDAVKPVVVGKDGDVTKPWTRPTAAAGVSAAAVEDLLRCFICLGQLNKAVMCPNCSKMACEACLKKWITEQKRECPHCRTHLFVSQLVQCRFVDDLQQQLKEMIEAPSAVESVDVCNAHHAPLHYYCVTCSDAICSDCAMFDERHRGHAFQHLEKVYVAHRDRVMAEADRLDAEIGRQKVAAEQVAEKMAGLRDAQRKMEEDLQVVLAQALHDVEAQVHDQMMRLFHEKSVYEEHAQHLADTSAAVRAAATSSSRAALIAQADRLVAQLHDAEHAFLGAAVPADALAGATPDVPVLVSPLVPAYTAVDVPLHAFSTYAQTGQVFYSAAFTANALSWRLKVYPTGNGAARGESLSVFVELVDGLPTGASADVQFKLAVMVPATAAAASGKAAAAPTPGATSSKADLDTDFTTPTPNNSTCSSIPLVEGASRELATTFARGECWGCSELVPLAHFRDGAYLADNDTLHLRFAVRAPSYAHQCALLDRQVAALQAEVASLRQANAAANAAAAAAASKPVVAASPRVARLAIATAPKVVANKTGSGSMSAPPSPGLRVRSATTEEARVALRRATAPLAKAASAVEVGSSRISARSVTGATGAQVKTKSWPAPTSPTVATATTGRTRSPSWTLSTSPKVRTRTTVDSSVSATHARFRPLSAVFNTLELEVQDDQSGASDLDDDGHSDSDSDASGSDDTATLARVVRAPPTATTLSASSGSDTASVVRDREAARLPPPLAPVPRHSTGQPRYAQVPAPASPRVIVAAAGLTIPDASLSDTEEGVSARASSPAVVVAAVPVTTLATGATTVMPRVKTSATGGSAASARGAAPAAGTTTGTAGTNAAAAATAPVV
ncbi:hypothetical protein GGF32_005396 [Allomyces javanicus]|nr:hypothetical protein GGF32_005396 [Allomyces javanicus]